VSDQRKTAAELVQPIAVGSRSLLKGFDANADVLLRRNPPTQKIEALASSILAASLDRGPDEPSVASAGVNQTLDQINVSDNGLWSRKEATIDGWGLATDKLALASADGIVLSVAKQYETASIPGRHGQDHTVQLGAAWVSPKLLGIVPGFADFAWPFDRETWLIPFLVRLLRSIEPGFGSEEPAGAKYANLRETPNQTSKATIISNYYDYHILWGTTWPSLKAQGYTGYKTDTSQFPSGAALSVKYLAASHEYERRRDKGARLRRLVRVISTPVDRVFRSRRRPPGRGTRRCSMAATETIG
jgi:hypothetical protein